MLRFVLKVAKIPHMETIIAVEKLSKTYKKNFQTIHALKHVSFEVPKNRILGILGPNGAGKTTLLKLITGIISPAKNSGAIHLMGSQDIDAVKHRMGFLPENPEFFKNITAYELLEFAQKVTRAQPSQERIHELLKQVRLFDERKNKVKHFSKGMRQRIGIAQAIIHSPELLILDEPMSGLDPPGRRMVTQIIESYYKEGKTILFSTHNLDDIEALCTHVMVLNRGEILLEKSLSQLREKSIYKIEVEDIENPEGKTLLPADSPAELWRQLEHARTHNMRIIKVQSGIARQLEHYYEDH
jgi:ABC-2 type transport system ATP-binding protein